MTIHRIDHVSVIVDDLPAAVAFFVDLGMDVLGEAELQGPWLDRLTALDKVKTTVVMLRTADGEANIELVKFHSPTDEKGVEPSFSNTLGIRHIAFAVEDIDSIVAKLKDKGTETFSDIYNYEGIYKLCYVRGPEGIILELAEEIKEQ